MTILETQKKTPQLTRRGLMIGGGAGVGLVLAWSLWPRAYPVTLTAEPTETLFGGFLKIRADGAVTIVSPEADMGQGNTTLFAQLLADELGADWQTIGLEAAPPNPLYGAATPPLDWTALAPDGLDGLIHKPPIQITTEAFDPVRFERQARDAGATARALLCKAAARRWDADWRACDTTEGFVFLGAQRLRFGQLAEAAAGETLDEAAPLRTGPTGRLMGKRLARIDAPSKADGSANFTADVRLPNMVFAAIRRTEKHLSAAQIAKAENRSDVLRLLQQPGWTAAIARTWWAANAALDTVLPPHRPRALAEPIAQALDDALARDGDDIASRGDVAECFADTALIRADYDTAPSLHGSAETLSATAVLRDGQLELWLPTQAPEIARQRAAAAAGMDPKRIIIHAVQIGGSFGRAHEQDAVEQAAFLATQIEAPVQLCWSRREDTAEGPPGPPAKVRMIARLGPGGQVLGLRARIAAPAALAETRSRLLDGMTAEQARLAHRAQVEADSVSGAFPPYAIPHVSIVHHPADIGLPSGKLRGGADRITVFAREVFMDELAAQSGVDPFSFRIAMLGGSPRLAACLTRVTALGGWEGGVAGSQQGLACHAMHGSHIAVLAEAHMSEAQEPRVTRITAVADIGRIVNPDIALQQIEGGLLFGLAQMLGRQSGVRISDTPVIHVEILPSRSRSGAMGEIGVTAIAPAVANALWAGSARRFRSLPLSLGT